MSRTPTLYVFAGLPATGKTTLATLLARRFKAVYFRIDTVELALAELCELDVETQGYELTHRLVRDNLKLGQDVIVDCCNPVSVSRNGWTQLAISCNARCVKIEVQCSDLAEHKRRLDKRQTSATPQQALTWAQVCSRYYEPWQQQVLVIDSAGKTIDNSIEELITALSKQD
jgi:predicted kinase